ITFDTNKGVKSINFGVNSPVYEERQENFDAWQKALYERDPTLALERYGEIPELEVLDPYQETVLKHVIVEEHKEGELAWELIKELTPGSEEFLKFLEAEAEVYCKVYKATQEPITVLGEVCQNCFLFHEKELLIMEEIEGFYKAIPLNFYDIGAFFGNYGKLVNHYFDLVPQFKDYPETFFKPMEEILGIDALKEAATQTTSYAHLINAYLNQLATDGIITIDELLTDLGYTRDQEGYSKFRDDMWQNKLLGKSITIEGTTYTFPSKLETVSEYNQMFEIIDAALGDLAEVGTMRAYSEADVASAMKEALDWGLTPNQLDWDMMKVVGINDLAELNNLLDNYPVTTSKGYSLTPKKLLVVLLNRIPYEETSHFLMHSKIIIGVEKTEQPLVKMFLTENDFKQLCQICKDNGLSYDPGFYDVDRHTVIHFGLECRLHELTHAQDYARLDSQLKSQGLSRDLRYMKGDMERMVEGHAQEGARGKLIALDNIFLSKMPGYEISGYSFGPFMAFASALNQYIDISLSFYQFLEGIGWKINIAPLAEAAERYLAASNRYEELGWGYTTTTKFIDDYLYRALTPDYLSVDDFLRMRGHLIFREGVQKFLAIADPHGGYEQMVSLLIKAGIIERGGTLGQPWVFAVELQEGGKDIFTITEYGQNIEIKVLGDLIDEGGRSVEVVDLIMELYRLKEPTEYPVIVLKGNHELKILRGVLIEEGHPKNYGLEGYYGEDFELKNTLQQFGYPEAQIERVKELLTPLDTQGRTTLHKILYNWGIFESVLRGINSKATERLKFLLFDTHIIDVTTTSDGTIYIFVHAGFPKNIFDIVKGEDQRSFFTDLTNKIETNPNILYPLIEIRPEEWIYDSSLLKKIRFVTQADFMGIGHANRAGGKFPNEIKLVGAKVGGFSIWALDNTISPGRACAIGGKVLPVQAYGLLYDATKPSGEKIKIVSGDPYPSPIITDPYKFTFNKDETGRVTIVSSTGKVVTVHRDVFNDWYCDGSWIYTSLNGKCRLNIELGDVMSIEYTIASETIKVSLPFTLFTDELGTFFPR
ncbi:MAG TPA: hypothetical protein ENG55_03225, partial [Candidatus Omnitrophica bacterium]|nr:hypothetical protein [Candidatus Omnitrophota bacterium]